MIYYYSSRKRRPELAQRARTRRLPLDRGVRGGDESIVKTKAY